MVGSRKTHHKRLKKLLENSEESLASTKRELEITLENRKQIENRFKSIKKRLDLQNKSFNRITGLDVDREETHI